MIPSLVQLAARLLGKYFLSIESFRYIPDDLLENIFDEYLQSIASLSIINENDLIRIVKSLTDYHCEIFCSSFCYYQTNHLHFLTEKFYLQLFNGIQLSIIQLDLSNAFERFDEQTKGKVLNIIGQMESIEYLRLTHNRLDDEDIRLLTASNRIRSKALCHLQSLHLQGNNLTSRSGRFLKALTSLDTLYISLVSSNKDKSVFRQEFENLHECTCSTQHAWEEIVNRGWIAKIPQLQSPTTTADNHFYRKRRRVDHEDSTPLTKLVRFCSVCRPISSAKSAKSKEKITPNLKGFIDSTEANDLLACYL